MTRYTARKVSDQTTVLSGRIAIGKTVKTTWGVIEDASGRVVARGFWTKADAVEWIAERERAQ